MPVPGALKGRDAPSPAKYHVPSAIGKGPRITLGARTAFRDPYARDRKLDAVGPGIYRVGRQTHGQLGISLKSRPVEKTRAPDSPGPAAYDPNPQRPSRGFTISGRPARTGVVRTDW